MINKHEHNTNFKNMKLNKYSLRGTDENFDDKVNDFNLLFLKTFLTRPLNKDYTLEKYNNTLL